MTEIEIHVAEGRVVLTWCPGGKPLGLITGVIHNTDRRGFEVDHIVRFPDSDPGTGAAMCAALLPKIVEHFKLSWVLVKISDTYRPAWLTGMARRFGFVLQGREGSLAYWRLDL